MVNAVYNRPIADKNGESCEVWLALKELKRGPLSALMRKPTAFAVLDAASVDRAAAIDGRIENDTVLEIQTQVNTLALTDADACGTDDVSKWCALVELYNNVRSSGSSARSARAVMLRFG